MDLKDIKLDICKYDIEVAISAKGLKDPYIVESSFINSVILEKHYEKHYFPYFEITMSLPIYVVREMKKDHENVTATINMKIGRFNQYLYLDNNANPHFSPYLSSQFMVFMDDESPDPQSKYQERWEDENGKKDGMSNQDIAVITISLYNKKFLIGSKNITSQILVGVTLTEALTYVICNAGLNQVLMSPASNNSAPSPFFIFPIPALEHMEHICNEWYMHEHGTMIFFDLKKIYILDRQAKCTAWVTNEFKKTYICSFSDLKFENSIMYGCYSNGKEKYNLCSIIPTEIEATIESYANEQFKGTNLRIIDTYTGKVDTLDTGAKSLGNGQLTGSVYTKQGNHEAVKALAAELKESSNVVRVLIEGSDLSYLEPNKEFIISLDNTKYKYLNGSYRITSMIVNFKKDGKHFIPTALCEFRGGK